MFISIHIRKCRTICVYSLMYVCTILLYNFFMKRQGGYICVSACIEYFPIPENESQTVILSFIGDRDLLDYCGQSSGGGSTRAAEESANVQHICKVTESIVIITSSEVTKSSFLYYP